MPCLSARFHRARIRSDQGETDAAAVSRPTADLNVASPAYFSILNIPLDGRDFSIVDKADGAPVVIVNRTMTKYWKKGSPLGGQVSLDNGDTWATVVGIAGDVRQYGLNRETVPQVFVPLTQSGGVAGRFLVRTESDPLTVAQAIRTEIHAVDPDMPIKNVTTLAELRSEFLATPKLTAMLLTVFAALALIVTIAGISGVIAISVTHRLEEFGVRMALGRPAADPQSGGRAGSSPRRRGPRRRHRAVVRGDEGAVGLLFATTLHGSGDAGPGLCGLPGSGRPLMPAPAWRATSADPEALRAD